MSIFSTFSLILSLILGFFGFLRTSSSRFAFYSLYEDVEERLRILCVRFNELKLFKEMNIPDVDRSYLLKDWASKTLIACDKAQFYRASDGTTFLSIVHGIKKHGVISHDQIISTFEDKANLLLKTCRLQKKQLEGCFKGNFKTFCILFQSIPISKQSIMRDIYKTWNH